MNSKLNTDNSFIFSNQDEAIARNKELIARYPFLLVHNRWTDKVPEDYDYTWTELDDMPDGWRKAFGEQMCDEILHCLEKADFVNDYRIMQIKEKFGGLRWYDNGAPESIHNELNKIINKYINISYNTCIKCGKPAKWVQRGWVNPFCTQCAQDRTNGYNARGCNYKIESTFIPIEKFYARR